MILLKISNINYIEFIKFLIKNDIYYSDLVLEKNYILIKTKYEHIKLIKKYCAKKNVKIKKYYGIKRFKNYIKKEYIFLLSSIIGIFIIFTLSKIIFEVEVITSNKTIKQIIIDELKENGIEKYKFIKEYKEIEKIKKQILNNNKDKLEWIEISRKGTKYIINLTERVKNEIIEKSTVRNIVSSKDALILKIVNKKGMPIKYINDYVKKGEVIISGNIIRGEDTIVDSVEADASVYGEVWYTANITVPYEYVEYSPTGKIVDHYYLEFPNFNMTLFGYYKKQNVIIEKEVLIDKPYLFFKLIKEKKTLYSYEKYKVTEKEALKEAIKRAERSISMNLSKDEYIIDKKVLNYSTFSSKINVEVFFRVYENIVSYSEISNTLESE